MKNFALHHEHELLLAMPGHNVLLRPGKSLPSNHRELRVVENLLIQSRGTRNEAACQYCEKGLGIYKECRSISGWFGGACGSCKRNDGAAGCTLSDIYKAKQELLKEEQIAKEEKTTRCGRTTQAPSKYTK